MDFIRTIQLDLMVFLSGACGILAFMTLITKSLPRKTKRILATMEIAAMLLLIFERFAYIYEGSTTRFGYVMIRVSNWLVYFFLLFLTFLLTRYIGDVFVNEGKMKKIPRLLRVCDFLCLIAFSLLVVSSFTGLYYTIDAENHYHRSTLHLLCYVFPFLIILLLECAVLLYRKRLSRYFVRAVLIGITIPTVASIVQMFFYGVSLTTLTMVFIVIIFYTLTLNYLSEAADRARKHEVAFFREQQKKEFEMFEETTEALANAVDAKDKYTSGHSIRVAYYSRLIAKEAHLPEKTCEQIYFAALLHDVGKIGVPLEIINKVDISSKCII